MPESEIEWKVRAYLDGRIALRDLLDRVAWESFGAGMEHVTLDLSYYAKCTNCAFVLRGEYPYPDPGECPECGTQTVVAITKEEGKAVWKRKGD